MRYPAGTDFGSHVAQLLRELEISCVLDVGANVGGYGKWLRALGYRGRIVSFEPATESATRLRQVADRLWQVEELALGNITTRAKLYLAANSQLHSLAPPNAYGLEKLRDAITTVGSQEVDVVRLDDVIDRYVQPDDRVFLKIDTQGTEAAVLDGARSSLRRILALHVELALQPTYTGQTGYLEFLRALTGLGFVPTHILPFLRNRRLEIIEAECVLRRDSSTC
jgi:FkbM family methyltransferase